MAPKKKKVGPLTPSQIFVRIRPIDTSGKTGHGEGEALGEKTLGSWTDESIVIQDKHEKLTFDFPKKVVAPEADQLETFESMLPPLLEAFTTDSNVLFFAYGQTGTGKTHTILGTDESLKMTEMNDGWGIFPRVCHWVFEKMESKRADGSQCILSAAAVEFYCGGAFDLNNPAGKFPVQINTDSQVYNNKQVEVSTMADVMAFFDGVWSKRNVSKTKMNAGSSRAHTALILKLMTLTKCGCYRKTTFSLIDLAGSERASKTGQEVISAFDAMSLAGKLFMEGKPEKLPIAHQGVLINTELSSLASEVAKATEAAKQGQPRKVAKALNTDAVVYMGSCCDGRALAGAVVCLSQAKQNGSETWFSCKYGTDLAKLAVPFRPTKSKCVVKERKAAAKALKEAKEGWKQYEGVNPATLAGHKANIYYLRKGALQYCEEDLAFMDKLMELQGKSKDDPERTTGGELQEAFEKFDTEGVGYLTKEQLTAVLGRGGDTPEEAAARVDELISKYDADGDGFIQYQEFAKAFQSARFADLEAKGLLAKPA